MCRAILLRMTDEWNVNGARIARPRYKLSNAVLHHQSTSAKLNYPPSEIAE